jgi:hypothetical protein
MRKILIVVMVCAFYACTDSSQLAQLKVSNQGTTAAGGFKKSSKNARIALCTTEDASCSYIGLGWDPDTGSYYDVNQCTNLGTGRQEYCFNSDPSGGSGNGGTGGTTGNEGNSVSAGTDNGDGAPANTYGLFRFPPNPTDGDLYFPKDPSTGAQTNYRFIYSYCAQKWVRGGPVNVTGTPPANPTCGTTYSATVGAYTYNYVYSAWCSFTSGSRVNQAGWYYEGPGSLGIDGCASSPTTGAPSLPTGTVVSTITKMNHSYFEVTVEYSIDGGNTWIQIAGSSFAASIIATGDDFYQFRARITNATGMYGHSVSNIHISTPWGSSPTESWSDPQYNPDGTPASYTTLPTPAGLLHSNYTIFIYVQ